MRAYVFTDPSLERHAGQFVWLAINTEKTGSAAFLERYPLSAWPTYLIIDPEKEQAILRWVGGASVEQLHAILDQGHEAYGRLLLAREAGNEDSGVEDDVMLAAFDALARADVFYGQDSLPQAIATYERAITIAPVGWVGYSRAVESLLFAYDLSKMPEREAQLALAAYPRLRGRTSSANVAASGLAGAVALPPDHPRRAGMIDTLETYVREVIADTTLDLSGDEKSGVFISLYDAELESHDEAGAHDVAEEWAHHLETAAARATTPEQRTVYDSHRLSAYLELGEPERAIPMLEQSLADFPDDYNPPARLAVTYMKMKRWDLAIEYSKRALALAYGPRKLLIYTYYGDILAGAGDTAAATAIIDEAIAYGDSLPEAQRSKSRMAALQRRRDALR